MSLVCMRCIVEESFMIHIHQVAIHVTMVIFLLALVRKKLFNNKRFGDYLALSFFSDYIWSRKDNHCHESSYSHAHMSV